MGLFGVFGKKKASAPQSGEAVKKDYGLVEIQTRSERWSEDFTLMCDTDDQVPYARRCLEYFDALPDDMEKRLKTYLWRYYKDYEEYYQEDFGEDAVISEDEIFDHVEIGSLIVGSDCRQDRIEFSVDGNCDWEPEHGLEVTISDGAILYVGPFEDYGPNSERLAYALEHYGFYDPDAYPIMNYADKE